MQNVRYTSLKEFWPYYVREHSNPRTRQMHFVGNTNLIAWLLVALIRRSPALAALGVISSYALAWIGHFFMEKNVPATFKYPILSAFGDILMYVKMWRGQMDADVTRYARSDTIE
jgi:hypothetical protein